MINLDPNFASCGCRLWDIRCHCLKVPFIATRTELKRMTKSELFILYTRTLSDEMSPIMWRGFTKGYILEMFLDGENSVELTPFL